MQTGLGKCNLREGFTLLEILLTMTVLAILGTIVIGGVNLVNGNARAKRNALTCEVLEVALNRYKTEYNQWPVDREGDNETRVFDGEDNAEVFSALREENDQNFENLRFIDETTLFTTEDGDLSSPVIQLSKTTAGSNRPLVYVPKNNRKSKTSSKKTSRVRYFKVTINFDTDTVKVEAPEPSLNKKDLRDEDRF